MKRQCFLDFTVEGDNLDPVAMGEAVGLPYEVYYKGQITKSEATGREVTSSSTRWLYSVDTIAKTEPFLRKHLEIISKKMPILEGYLKSYEATLELIIYEDDPGKEHILLSQKILTLLSKIGIKFLIVFKNLELIYGI